MGRYIAILLSRVGVSRLYKILIFHIRIPVFAITYLEWKGVISK